MTVYTIVVYRPNGEDYYRGHVNARSDSLMKLDYFEGKDAAARYAFHFLKWYDELSNEDKRRSRHPEITILVNGMAETLWDGDTEYVSDDINEIERLIQSYFSDYKKEKAEAERLEEEKQAKLKEAIRIKQMQEKELQERAMLQLLKGKYENGSL